MGTATTNGTERPTRFDIGALAHGMRADQWGKNLLVFAGLIFGQRLRDAASVETAVFAFAVFCLLSSAVYLVNDVVDRDADRRHPLKSKRPIAAGRLSVRTALVAAAALSFVSLAAAFRIGPAFAVVSAAYLALMTVYSTALKHQVIIDALAVSGGFVLRALGGAVAIGVPFSHWLLLLTLLLALFLTLGKRRAEIVALEDYASMHRPALAHYSAALLDQLLAIVTASTLLAYAFYTISPETLARFGTDRLLFTLPLPMYGLFRYLYLVHLRGGGGNPSEHLFSDRPLLACVGLWALAIVVIIYGPWR
jgi:4-hydroxybenzoate polyprenyltransferase